MIKKLNGGFVAITSVLVISAIVVSIIISTSILGVGEAKNSLAFKKGREAKSIANSCAEEALLRLRNDETYTGTATPLIVGGGACTIAVTGAGSDRTILVIADIIGPPRYVKKVSMSVTRAGNSINLVSINEVE